MRVLFLNHTGVVSGAERSLLALIENLPSEVEPCLACPPGPLAELARERGLSIATVPGTDGSLRLHPVHTARALLDLLRAALAVRRQARRAGIDLVHANTSRAGLVATTVSRLGGSPAIVHVRDRLPPGAISDTILRILVNGARVVIANSHYTADRFPSGRAEVRVIDNPVDVESLAALKLDRTAPRARLGLEPDAVVLAVIGQITPWKGQELAIRVASQLSELERPVRLLIVGSAKFVSPGTRFDNRAYEQHLRRLAGSLGVADTVSFLGEREDVPEILAATDLLLAPSWEEPFGRSVVEAMAMGVPVIATNIGGPAEIIEDGADGCLLPPRQPEVWAEKVRVLLSRPDQLRAMGQRGRERALARFGTSRHVEAVLEVYRSVLGQE
jgi:glycosyltransferase involved in cell wall biosynthesis